MNNSSIYPPTYPSTVITTVTGTSINVGSTLYSNITNPLINPVVSKNNSVTIGDSMDSTLTVKGNAEFDGDIKLKGKSLDETLTRIEQRLAIIHVNTRLEKKWEKLKELGDQYRELEADILEKEKIVEILKR
jgi:hypothetical protein